MNVPRSALGFALIIGCTVGEGGGGTLSGGASASAGATSTAQSDDGSDATSDPITSSGSSDGGAEGGPSSSSGHDDSTGADASSGSDGADGSSGSEGGDGSSSTDTGDDLADGVLDVTIIAHDDCTITTMPASISVPEGTEFTVNWISAATSATNVDVAKIDAFNAVPIIVDMEPGTSYHDEVRVWCGMLFTGTFDFEITSCFDPQLIPVDCGG